MKRILSLLIVVAMLFTVAPMAVAAEENAIKNVIYLIPDGGGMVPYELAEQIKMAGGWNEGVFPNPTPVEKGPMSITPYLVGSITTRSADKDITDSAAGGTALSSGYKTNNGYIGVDPSGVPHATLLEAAQMNGKKTGMISIYEWMNATPAAFSAHHSSRSTYSKLSEQITNQGIDVMLGVGFGVAGWGSIDEAVRRGYTIVNNTEELNAMKSGDKVWGNILPGGFPYDIEKDVNIPSLSDLTAAAIRALDGSEEGFFLMVEGSKIDGGGHQNFDIGMAGDFLAFDDACRVAVEYAKTRKDTMVIIAPDHDTGGMVLPENMEEVIATLQQGKSSTDIKWESLQHTARNGGLFIYAPEGVAYPEGISGNDIGTMKAWEENVIDNTDVPKYIAKVMGLDLEGTSAKLFVDVTDKGTYDEETKLFKFTDSKYTARADASYAYYGDECFDLDGQICVFVKNHFYVPQLLLDIMDGKVSAQPSTVGPTLYSTLSVTMPGVDVKDWDASLKVKNLLPTKEFNGKITFTYPEPFAAMEPIEVKALAGDEERIITFKCPEFDISKSGLRFKYKITAEDGTESEYSSKFVPAMYATYTDTPIVVDGVIDDEQWKNSLVIKCDTMDSLVDIEDWKGERDMSSEFSILWDEENLYFYAITCDETFYTNNTMIPLRNLDSITIGLYEDTDNAFARGENCSSLYEHLEFAIIDGQPDARRDRVQKFITGAGTSKSYVVPQDENFELKTRRDGDYAIYEMRISWKNLYGYEYSPLEDDIMAFAFVATDNDGAGKRGYMAYGSGLGGSRVVSKFSKMIMLDPHGKKAEIPEKVTVLYNGEEVVGDVEPINYNGRPMIPLRAFAEKAGITVEWNDEIKTVILTKGETKVEVPTSINNTILKAGLDFFVVRVNGEDRIIDAVTILEGGRTLVPLRAITEGFGFKAHFDGATQTVTITD